MFEKTNVQSTKLTEVSMQAMLRYKLKRVVLWLCDFREGKMLMQKNQIGAVVNLSLPSQSQTLGDPNVLNGNTLLQKLCKKYFNTESVIIKWTLEFVYIYKDGKNDDVGVFIYNAKTNDLPKETMKTQYVSMKVVYNLTKQPSKSVSGKEVKIYEGDINLIYEIFKVVALIRGGLISSASKEFNEVVARLVSRTVPPHLLSVISESKRKNNIEANINFLIKLFFSPNNLFFLSGSLPYYIHSYQRNCPIYTIVKQEDYDNDSYLTCLKLFLQTETDFKNKDNMNNLRVGCAIKKKLITDNFSAVWDNFWSDLIQNEEQTEFDDELERVEVATEETTKKKDGDDGDDDEDDNALCLVKAIQSGDKMYTVGTDWDIGEYYPISYKDVYYNISPNGNYKFNNEFFHHLNLNGLVPGAPGGPPPRYTGFECMKYYNNGNNPVLFLGGNSGVFKLDLKTYKLTRFITATTTLVLGGGGAVTPVVKCMDILDVEEGYMLVGGNFTTLITFDYDYINNIPIQRFNKPVLCYAAMINLKTYEIINLYNDPLVPPPIVVTAVNEYNVVSKICICKNKKIIKKKGMGNQEKDVYGYIAMIGGYFQIMTVTNDNNPPLAPPQNNIEKIINIGCVLININNAAAATARLLAVDSKASLVDPAPPAPANIANSSGIFVTGGGGRLVPRVLVTSIVCNENEVDNDDDDDEKKKETVFFIGGNFNRYTYIDYPVYEATKAAAAPGAAVPLPLLARRACNSIIKLTLSCEYDNDDVISKYNQKSIFEPIDVNTVGNNDGIFYASLVYKVINSKKYLFCLTGFIRVAALPLLAPANAVYTRLNIFDVESSVNYQTPQDITYNGYLQVVNNNYMFQTLLLTVTNNNNKNIKNNAVSKDDEYVLIISFTTSDGAGVNTNHIFTCNVSNLNKIPATPVEIVSAFSNINQNISNNDSVTDMCVIKNNTNDNVNAFNVFVTHTNSPDPLTIRSNYQEIGDWNMMSASTDSDNVKLSNFIKKILEMKKMFELNPSMFLFLQNIDMRGYNTRITKIVLDKMRTDLLAQAYVGTPGIVLFHGVINPLGASSIDIFSACNDIDQKIMNIVNFIYTYKTSTENLIPVVVPANLNNNARDIHIKIYNFINDLIFILVYVGCNSYAETVCNNYVNLIIVPRAGVPPPPVAPVVQLNHNNWRERFAAIITTYIPVLNEIIDAIQGIAKKYKTMLRVNPESRYYYKVCSDPDTESGIAYLIYNFNLNLNTLLTYKNQENIQNKIYEFGNKFFDDNKNFYGTRIDETGNTIKQINFCSFYKFERKTVPPAPAVLFDDIGSMDSDTIYVSVNVNNDEDKIKSSQMLEYLRIIKNYFMKLKTGQPIVDIGISGPIRRIIFGGDFGCNLLHDAEVCKKFELEKMKIYTRTDNQPNYVNEINGANHIFVIDADLEPVAAQDGGGGAKRITIGERIEERRVAVASNKRRTRRKVPSQSSLMVLKN